MRILQVTNFFKPSFEAGGVARVAYDLSKSLSNQNHNVTVFTTNRSKNKINVRANIPLNIEGMTVYYFENLRKYFSLKMIPIPYYMPIVARKCISNYDVIHIHEHRTLSAIIIYYYVRKHNIPYILQSHGSVLAFLQKQKYKMFFDSILGYRILKNATKVIALNEDEASQYEQMGIEGKNIEIIPNAINLDEYNNTISNSTFKKMYNIPANNSIILYVGRIHKNKGVDLIINALPLIRKTNQDVKLIVIGPDDGFQEELEEMSRAFGIEQNVIFTGFVDKDIKMAALADADVFVTPRFSGFPISFLEACVFGLPIVTTNEGDNLDWIHNKVGYVVQYDKNELSDAILNILNDQELKVIFGNEAKDVVNDRFSMDSYIKKIEHLYEECI